jgi:hypothetical protein
MTPEEACEALRGRPLVPVTRGAIEALKRLHERCLEAEVPAALRRPPEPGG